MKQTPDGATRLAELQYLLRYGGRATASASVSLPDRARRGHGPYAALAGHFVSIQRLAGKSNSQSAWRMVG